MGNFYTNIVIKGVSQQQAVDVLVRLGRDAYVSPAVMGVVGVYDAETEDQDIDILTGLCQSLSAELACPALAVLNHDDDVLIYDLCGKGDRIDSYNSAPEFFAEDESEPKGGNASKLAAAFGHPEAAAEIEAALRGEFTFALERHGAICNALGIPMEFSILGYNYIEGGEAPEIKEGEFIQVGG